jgi:hypothetical protein
MRMMKPVALAVALLAFLIGFANAQDVEPRRWSHIPKGSNFVGGGYAYSRGDVLFDPVLEIENVEVELHTAVFSYIHSFEFLERSARIDFVQGYRDARWEGLLSGAPASAVRQGFTDTLLRFSVNLLGAPPLEREEFAAYRKSVTGGETIVGAGLAVQLPTGNYLEDRLLNIGSNRFTFRPQLGVVHNRGKWSMEFTGSAWLFTDNDNFFGGSELQTSPLFTAQGHLVYTFRPGLWIGAGAAYGIGAQSTLNGSEGDDKKGNFAWGISAGYPITSSFGFKVGYFSLRTQEPVGGDVDVLSAGFSFMW